MCDCHQKLDEVLAGSNARIAMGLQVTKDLGLQARILIATEKIDSTKRKPLPPVAAGFCPWCGEKAGNE